MGKAGTVHFDFDSAPMRINAYQMAGSLDETHLVLAVLGCASQIETVRAYMEAASGDPGITDARPHCSGLHMYVGRVDSDEGFVLFSENGSAKEVAADRSGQMAAIVIVKDLECKGRPLREGRHSVSVSWRENVSFFREALERLDRAGFIQSGMYGTA